MPSVSPPTWDSLIGEVRAQISVDPSVALAWLLDRARVLNAEARWLFVTGTATPSGDVDGRYYDLPEETIWLEAVLVNGIPYQRSTQHAMDARWAGNTGNTAGIYALGGSEGIFQIHPRTISPVEIRHVYDVVVFDSAEQPPFPTDFYEALVDGAVAIGLARMDERFDSAGYFDAKFGSAIDRLRRRRHAQVGRGATPIRVVL